MKAGKTPYEIRSDLLRLAYDILSTRVDLSDSNQNVQEITSEEVIKEAQRLNSFVSAALDK